MGSAREEQASLAHWVALVIAILASQAGQVLLKLGATGLDPANDLLDTMIDQMFRWTTIIGLGCYGGGTLFYAVALRRIPMSVALPCTAISYVSATIFGMVLFNEPITGQHLAALAMVCAGVVLLADFSGNPEKGRMVAPVAATPLSSSPKQ